MTLQTIKLADHVSLGALFDHCEKRRTAAPRYEMICNRRILDAYNAARKENLRFHRKTNILRNNRLGILSRPVTPYEWPEATRDEAREALMDEVWCQAVSAFNREQMEVAS